MRALTARASPNPADYPAELCGCLPTLDREEPEKLGRHRWKVERTFAWLHRYRRLLIRWDRRDDIHLGFLELACCLIAYRFVEAAFC